MADKGLTTEDLDNFKKKQKEDRTKEKLKSSVQSSGQVEGTEVRWDYSKGKFVK